MNPVDEFDSPCLALNLHMAARALGRHYNRFISISGIEGNEMSVLTAIRRNPDKSITELAKLLDTDRTTLVRNAQHLVRRKLIKRQPGGGRAVKYELTALADQILAQAMPIWNEVQDSLKKTLGPADFEQIRVALKNLRRVIQD